MIAVYCRVSTEDQHERGTIENQIEFAKKYCDLHELPIFKIYKEDGISGTIPLEDRPCGKELLQDAENKKFDTLLLYKLDRLGRSARITLNSIHTLEELDIQIKSMTEPFDTSSPSGRFMITMLAGVADLERSTILERMWLGTNRAAREGKWLGGIVPYGYYVDNKKYLQINNNKLPNLDLSEADVIKLIFSLSVDKGYSSIQISDYLNSLGIPTSYMKDNRRFAKGKRKVSVAGTWGPSTVLRILRNKTYMGIHEYGKRSKKKNREIITRKVPAIVSEDTWYKAQETIEDNKIEANRNRKRQYLLRGLIKCSICGRTYVGANHGKNKYYYICNGKITYRDSCKSKNLNGKYIEELVWNDIVEFINNPKDSINVLKENLNSKNNDKLLEHKKCLEQNLKTKDTEKQSILDLFRKNLIDYSDVEIQLNKINEEYNNIILAIDYIEKDIKSCNDINNIDTINELLNNMKKKINGQLNFEDKRKIVKMLVDKITVITKKDISGNKKAVLHINYVFKVSSHTDKGSYSNFNFFIENKDVLIETERNYSTTNICGTRIRKTRLEKSLTIKELSIQSKVDKNQISNIELGKHIPTIKTLKKLEKVLNKSFGWLGGFDVLPEDNFGMKLLKYRLKAGYSQMDLSKLIGVNDCTIRSWEKNKSIPNKSNLEKLRKILNV